MKAKWRAESQEKWSDHEGRTMETVVLYDDNRLDPWKNPLPQATVWWDADGAKAYCTRCQGSLSAMLQTCVHALAVKRIRSREAANV